MLKSLIAPRHGVVAGCWLLVAGCWFVGPLRESVTLAKKPNEPETSNQQQPASGRPTK
jgi:hypothetical protein